MVQMIMESFLKKSAIDYIDEYNDLSKWCKYTMHNVDSPCPSLILTNVEKSIIDSAVNIYVPNLHKIIRQLSHATGLHNEKNSYFKNVSIYFKMNCCKINKIIFYYDMHHSFEKATIHHQPYHTTLTNNYMSNNIKKYYLFITYLANDISKKQYLPNSVKLFFSSDKTPNYLLPHNIKIAGINNFHMFKKPQQKLKILIKTKSENKHDQYFTKKETDKIHNILQNVSILKINETDCETNDIVKLKCNTLFIDFNSNNSMENINLENGFKKIKNVKNIGIFIIGSIMGWHYHHDKYYNLNMSLKHLKYVNQLFFCNFLDCKKNVIIKDLPQNINYLEFNNFKRIDVNVDNTKSIKLVYYDKLIKPKIFVDLASANVRSDNCKIVFSDKTSNKIVLRHDKDKYYNENHKKISQKISEILM